MIQLSSPTSPINGSLQITGSKSISNRMLILKEVFGSKIRFENLSDSEDTKIMLKALNVLHTKADTVDVGHAGTDMRFLTALCSVTDGSWYITGSERIRQRPVKELVTALNSLGADITYTEKRNFLPLFIHGGQLRGGTVEINAGISSQFISALLLISPKFKKGLILVLKGNVVSQPYIDMTVVLLKQFSVDIKVRANTIKIKPSVISKKLSGTYLIESDWSSASYWYGICALSENAMIRLSNFNEQSLQADSILPELYGELGVSTVFKGKTVILSRKKRTAKVFKYNFINCPDIAQTLAVTCVGLGIEARLSGLKTLKIKETDRITALSNELAKTGANITVRGYSMHIRPGQSPGTKKILTISTYSDHRMAMSFAQLAMVYRNIRIEDPDVVAKSYPRFWEDLKSLGFNVTLQP